MSRVDWIFLSSDCQNTSIYFPGCSSCWLLQVLASDESINKNNQPHLDLISSNGQQSELSWTHQTIQTTLLLPVLTHQPFMIAKKILYTNKIFSCRRAGVFPVHVLPLERDHEVPVVQQLRRLSEVTLPPA